jgi:hypothetical protein
MTTLEDFSNLVITCAQNWSQVCDQAVGVLGTDFTTMVAKSKYATPTTYVVDATNMNEIDMYENADTCYVVTDNRNLYTNCEKTVIVDPHNPSNILSVTKHKKSEYSVVSTILIVIIVVVLVFALLCKFSKQYKWNFLKNRSSIKDMLVHSN